MDLNSSEFSASFFGEVCTKAKTSTPDASKKTVEIVKRKLTFASDEPPAKQRHLNDTDIERIENTVSVININDTIESGKTLVTLDRQERVDAESNDDSRRSLELYRTISETYCTDTNVSLSTISSISLNSNDETLKASEFDEEAESVIFVSEALAPIAPTNRSKRMIIIDGSNVAFAHSAHKEFSVEGIKICIDHFDEKGFDVKAVVPQVRLKRSQSTNPSLLAELRDDGKVLISPCKSLPNGKSLISYDDRIILDLALKFDGVIISNDNYRDLFNERDDYKKIIQNRIIGYMFCNDEIVFPIDPYGIHGPTSEEILHKIV